MRLRLILMVLSLLVLFILAPKMAQSQKNITHVEKKIMNLTPSIFAPVYDLTVVISGNTIDETWHYDGDNNDWHFANFEKQVNVAGNTELKWSGPRDGTGAVLPIPSNASVQIGWATTAPFTAASMLDAFWTDVNGNRIGVQGQGSLSLVYNGGATIYTYTLGSTKATVTTVLGNRFGTGGFFSLRPITLTDIRYGIFSQLMDPDSLNEDNQFLNENLRLLAPGPIILQPGDSSILEIPDTIFDYQTIVLRFNNDAPGDSTSDSTSCIDYIMRQGGKYGVIPTLTEWGLIIFGIILVGFMTWVFLRRRKSATIRI